MKKTLVLCISLSAALAFTSCKSSESAYRKMYDKAKAQEASQQNEAETTSPQDHLLLRNSLDEQLHYQHYP